MNKIIFSSIFVGILSVGSLAWAEEGGVSPSPSVLPKPTVRIQVREQKDQLRQDIKNARENLKDETGVAREKIKKEAEDSREQLKNKTEEVREQLKQKAETMREDAKKRREEFNETIKTKRGELKDEIEAKREKLKTSLEKIKDERKKETVERIDLRIDALNEKMMGHFSDVLDKLEKMLLRVSDRADRASIERGLDVSAVRLAIDKANTAIASARSAIEVQSGKTYTIKVTTEGALKTDVGKSRQALGADLAKVRDAVKDAQSAVKDVAVALAQLVVKPDISASPSVLPSVSPTQTPEPVPAQ